MNKKLNTVLFLLGAFIVSSILILIFLIGSIVIVNLIFGESLKEYAETLSFFLIAAAILGSFFIYFSLISWFSKKINMDKYFTQIFKRKK